MTEKVIKINAAECATFGRIISLKVEELFFEYSNIKLSKAICDILGSTDFCGCIEDIEYKEIENAPQTSTHKKVSVMDIFSGISTTNISDFYYRRIEMTKSVMEIKTESINVPCDNMTQTSCPPVQMEQYTYSIKQLLDSNDKLQKENERLKQKCQKEHEERIIIEAKYNQLCNNYTELVTTATINIGNEDDARFLLGSISSGGGGKKAKKKTEKDFVQTRQTFKLHIDNTLSFNNAICKAYNYAINYKLISEDCKQDDFLAIFSGEATDAKIKWISTNGALKYFLGRLKKNKLIDIPKGFGIWQVTKSHFVDDKGKTITVDLANEHAPQNAELKANINDIVATLGIDY